MWDRAIEVLKEELRRFQYEGLVALQKDLDDGRRSIESLPSRRTWYRSPLSYRMGRAGSVDRDSRGHHTNAFTLAWDGYEPEGEYLPEELVLAAVEAEIAHRQARKGFFVRDKVERTKRRRRSA